MLVILHGWSDSARSFRRLGERLVADGIARGVSHVRLGDYVSMNDEVTFDDLCAAMARAWQRERLPLAPRSVDMIVHSTGALVARDWMTRGFTPATNPIRRLLMLAPANFGSPLAHKGRSFIGRVVKGFRSDRFFQVGARILHGLELASPYTWDLAMRDRFGTRTWYGPGHVLCTVLTGTSGYTGISAAANEDGTDGTVRVATANLNPLLLDMDFASDPDQPEERFRGPRGRTAFVRLARENHATIALKDGGPKDPGTLPLIHEALTVTDARFDAHCDRLETLAAVAREEGAARRFTQGYQHTVLHLQDDYDRDIGDYFFEVFAKRDGRVDNVLTRALQEQGIRAAHVNRGNGAYRALLFNCDVIREQIVNARRDLHLSVTAMPEFRRNGEVGYSTFGYDDIGSIRLAPGRAGQLFVPDRTLLARLRLRREQADRVFDLKPLG